MAIIKTKKRRKSSRYHGRKMGTCGTGARKNKRDSGHKGGKGMSGSGKRADHKKTLIHKLYGGNYFGKQGITSRGTEKDKRLRINLQKIDLDIESYVKKKLAKKTGDKFEINLSSYKILGSKDYQIKNKLIIKAKEASKSAIDQVKKAGGEIILPPVKKKSVASTPKSVPSKESKKKEKSKNKGQ